MTLNDVRVGALQKKLEALQEENIALNAYFNHLHSTPVRIAVRQCLEKLVKDKDLDAAELEMLILIGIERDPNLPEGQR